MSKLLLEVGNKFCRYCRLPSQGEYHQECEKSVQRWAEDNFDMDGFWAGFLNYEADAFIGKNNDVFRGFLPYTLYSIERELRSDKDRPVQLKVRIRGFVIIDQDQYTDMWLHDRLCWEGKQESHEHDFCCFLDEELDSKYLFDCEEWEFYEP